MHLVVEGRLDLTRQTSAGHTLILQSAVAGQVLAEASAYSKHYHCDAHAAEDSRLRTLPVKAFRDRLRKDTAASEAWGQHLARSIQSARMRTEIRTLRTVAERLNAWLDTHDGLPEKGAWSDLAAELGVSREALYRELSQRRG